MAECRSRRASSAPATHSLRPQLVALACLYRPFPNKEDPSQIVGTGLAVVPPSFVIQLQTAGRPLAGKRNSAKSSYALDGNNGRPIRPRLRPERGSDGSSQVHSISAQTPALTSPGSLKPRLRSTTPVPSLYPVFDCQARRDYTSHAPAMSRGGVDRQVGTHPPPRRESQCAYLVDNPAYLWYTRDRHLAQEGNVRNVKRLDCCRNRCHNSIRCLRRPNSSDCNPHRGSSGY